MINKYEDGSSESIAFKEGVSTERDRLLKVVNKYHSTFCEGELSEHLGCQKTMQIRYLYEILTEIKTLK